jgi:hypothetical protein
MFQLSDQPPRSGHLPMAGHRPPAAQPSGLATPAPTRDGTVQTPETRRTGKRRHCGPAGLGPDEAGVATDRSGNRGQRDRVLSAPKGGEMQPDAMTPPAPRTRAGAAC